MNTQLLAGMLAVLASLGSAVSAQGQAVDVTVSLDSTSIPTGGSTTLRVFARVVTAQQTNSSRIFSWYVDVLNTNGTVATAGYNAMLKTASDKNISTSSTGMQDAANRRGIYDTFLNLPGAGVNAAVELMAIPVTGLVAGQTRFRVQAGTGVGLSSDFLVATNGGGAPLTGGNYSLAEAVLTVAGAVNITVSMSVTNAAGGAKGVTLSFPTPAGFNYTAQYRDQLSGGVDWQSLPGAPHNSGGAFQLTTAGSRFYRVAATPSN